MEPFSSNLKRRAEQLGISNAEVARRAGLSDRRYENYITGRREPDLATLVRIASVLNVSIDELFGTHSEENVRTTDELFQERLAAALKALQNDDLQRLLVMIEALAAVKK
ncbi:helix-turn-helix transcriptional regulator [Rhizobium laguerreae]|uniref:helix-turn-helix domain-containing protein n=1 Tax=Rhizobium laguerreae TaxID=1076926 RepID=UPI001C9230BE|nr:helix-turn-helix transcriptional regulator [Rhizobium laguerreae]MBY3258705.1 helix-turn-helix transcriptional regulator [Rhizobium laguerreae]MBY3286542.1 helix-turn-helix transcriptional regulator [Rhizobium laguerreae]MBY3293205.1 helix-turn-helix transcriptional regulator [Rhizobium laguerreae]